jgi:hypothetical protein
MKTKLLKRLFILGCWRIASGQLFPSAGATATNMSSAAFGVIPTLQKGQIGPLARTASGKMARSAARFKMRNERAGKPKA